ncbi:hypothetical protein [Xenophilus sp. Marseille-Q4582]|uniref:portal protein n=1 Tax=Xenophilus sp. Marseille-Q4582 TaxID=2866600 RepID=UPI001CE45AF7|nr:hypothetical protein [Xenophilus sp. Marseille-Q4582]
MPRLIRKQAEWRYPALTEPFVSTDELFNVTPVSWEDRKAAQQNKLVLNYQFRTQIDRTAFFDEFVRAAVDEGTAIVRVGWEFEEEEYEDDFPQFRYVVDPAQAAVHEQLAQLKQESPSDFFKQVPEEMQRAHDLTLTVGQPIIPVPTGIKREKRTRVLKNRPTLEVCDYRNTIVDPTCNGDLSKANFIIYSFETSLSELKKEGAKYKNLDSLEIVSESILGRPDHEASEGVKTFNLKDKPRTKFVAYEYWGYWDIDGSGITKPIVVTWAGNTIIRMEESPFPDKELPFVLCHYLPKRKSTHGEPDGALLAENQQIAGAVTRGMIDILGRSANGQTGIRKDMLDVTNRRKYDLGLDYEFNPQVDPRQGVYMHTFPEIPQSAPLMLQLQTVEAESLTGVQSFGQQGMNAGSLGDVAASVRGVLDAASKREMAILRRLSNAVVKIGRKIIAMNAVFLSEREVIRLTNEEFAVIDREDLPGNFDLKLSISSAEEDANKAQQLSFMLQTIGNNMDPEMRNMILSDIARLNKMPDLAKRIENYQPQPDPLLQRKMQLEIELLEAQVESERAKAAELSANAILNQAKTGTEQVKQGNIQSDTDIKNLDFVEQESGVKQERELQKQGAQARAQTEMKMIDHGFKQQLQGQKIAADLLKHRNK